MKANKRLPSPLVVQPFPPLKLREGLWTGRDVLPTWARSFKSGKGAVDVRVDYPEDEEDGSRVPPLPGQVAAYRYLKENESAVTERVLLALFEEYSELQEGFGANEIDEGDEEKDSDGFRMPPVQSHGELKKLVSPSTITVLVYGKEDVAYLGIAMRCSWDVEHGVGVMLHKSRVVKIGGADVSFSPTLAVQDGGVELASPHR